MFIVFEIFVYALLFAILVLVIGDNFLVIKNSKPQKSDVIIVLGFPANKDGGPSKVIIDRVNKGVELLNAGYAPRLLFTGGGNPVESQVMANYAQGLGVVESAIFQEPKATTTIQNANNSGSIMKNNGWQTAIIVTSPYHSKRAFLIFEKHNFDFVVVTSQSIDQLNVFVRINDILHELFSFIGDLYQEKFSPP